MQGKRKKDIIPTSTYLYNKKYIKYIQLNVAQTKCTRTKIQMGKNHCKQLQVIHCIVLIWPMLCYGTSEADHYVAWTIFLFLFLYLLQSAPMSYSYVNRCCGSNLTKNTALFIRRVAKPFCAYARRYIFMVCLVYVAVVQMLACGPQIKLQLIWNEIKSENAMCAKKYRITLIQMAGGVTITARWRHLAGKALVLLRSFCLTCIKCCNAIGIALKPTRPASFSLKLKTRVVLVFVHKLQF